LFILVVHNNQIQTIVEITIAKLGWFISNKKFGPEMRETCDQEQHLPQMASTQKKKKIMQKQKRRLNVKLKHDVLHEKFIFYLDKINNPIGKYILCCMYLHC
jgi:hypothetical protein